MAYGFQVWNAAGKLQVDSNAGISRIVAIYNVQMKGASQVGTGISFWSQGVSGMALDGRWVIVMLSPVTSDGVAHDVVRVNIYSGYFTATVTSAYADSMLVTFSVIQI